MRDAGEFEALARGRAAYFANGLGDGSSIGSAILTRLAAIEPEIDNLREVLTWALVERQDVELGARLALALGRFWSTQLPREGQRWLELARDALGENPDPALAANLLTALAAMLAHGSFERLEMTQRALELSRSAGDPHTLSKALSAYGEQLGPMSRRDEARAAFEEALANARSIGSEWDTARALAGLCMLAVDSDDVAAARELGHQAIVIFEALGAIDGVAYVCIALGQAEFKAGNLERAISLTRRARSSYGELNNNRSSACAANYLTAFALEVDNFEEARFHARNTLALLRTDRHPIFLTEAIGHLAFLATVSGDPARGSLLQGYVGGAFQRVAHERGTAIEPCYRRHERLLVETLDAELLKERLAEGASLSEERAVEEALAASESQADGAIAD
jgi:tetratricopeptide (TPR) repeat protein